MNMFIRHIGVDRSRCAVVPGLRGVDGTMSVVCDPVRYTGIVKASGVATDPTAAAAASIVNSLTAVATGLGHELSETERSRIASDAQVRITQLQQQGLSQQQALMQAQSDQLQKLQTDLAAKAAADAAAAPPPSGGGWAGLSTPAKVGFVAGGVALTGVAVYGLSRLMSKPKRGRPKGS